MSFTTVVCGVVRDEEKYLITQRGDAKNFKKWEFPGGKVESDEDDFATLVSYYYQV
jgi:8-oxo-dGTP pyrophosphatase MutT (NUDIX family)